MRLCIKFSCHIIPDLYYNRSQDSVVSDIFRTVSALLSKEEHASFFMAGTRRDLNIEKIFSIAHEAGFVWTLEPGYVFDIFDNSTDEMTDLWRDAIFKFTRRANFEKEILYYGGGDGGDYDGSDRV